VGASSGAASGGTTAGSGRVGSGGGATTSTGPSCGVALTPMYGRDEGSACARLEPPAQRIPTTTSARALAIA
jgi:hypothetical protein